MSGRKNPTAKRIMADVRELQLHPSSRYFAAPLEDNMFEWHFTIRGPADTAFAGGMYHGRILLPTDYPFKPPNIVFLNVSSRAHTLGLRLYLLIQSFYNIFDIN
jgi:ubiquitin-conjugating enzyme E2 J1